MTIKVDIVLKKQMYRKESKIITVWIEKNILVIIEKKTQNTIDRF